MNCRAAEDCTAEAIFGIVIEEQHNHGDVVVSVLAMIPVCAQHVSEHVTEVRASATPDDFTVVNIMHAAGDPGRLS